MANVRTETETWVSTSREASCSFVSEVISMEDDASTDFSTIPDEYLHHFNFGCRYFGSHPFESRCETKDMSPLYRHQAEHDPYS